MKATKLISLLIFIGLFAGGAALLVCLPTFTPATRLKKSRLFIEAR